MEEKLSRRVIEQVRLHRSNDRELINDLPEVRQQLRDLRARFSVMRETVRRAEETWRSLDERKSLAREVLLRTRLVVETN